MGRTRSAPILTYAYLAAGVAAIGVYVAIPGNSAAATGLYAGIGAAATVALAAGGWAVGGPAGRAWYLFALGIALMTAGDTVYAVRDLVGWPNPTPSWSDYVYFAAYPALAAGLLLLIKASRSGDWGRRALEAGTVALALLAILWEFYFSHVRATGGQPLAERVTLGLYPSWDLVLLSLIVTYLLIRSFRPAEALLPAAVLCLLAADLVWAVAPDSYTAGDWMDRTWLASYVLWGAAALHPSSRAVATPTPRGALSRIAVFAIPLALLPASAEINVVRGESLSNIDVAIWTVVLALLVVRVTLLVGALGRSEEDFRRIFTDVSVGLARIDLNGVICDANDAALAILRGTREQVVGHDIFSFIAPEDEDFARAEFAVFVGGGEQAEERRLRALDGSEHWVATRRTLLPGKGGPTVLVDLRDVTGLRQAEAELRAGEERFRRLFAEAAIGLVTLDSELRITDANDALLRIGRGAREDVVGRPLTDFVPEDELAAVAEELGKAFELGHFGPTPHRLRTVPGDEVWVLTSVSVMPAPDGTTILIDIQDMSELKRIQDELNDANRQKDDLISVVSHDLRTPLTSIVGYLELIEEAEGDAGLAADRPEFIRVAVRNAERLARLVEDLLFVSRAHAGRAVLELQSVELGEIVRDALAAARPAADARQIELELVGDGAAAVVADEHRLAEAVENLLANAVKFSHEGSRVRVEIVEDDEDEVAVRVVDTGPGIPPEDVPHIFERFYRSSATEDAPGSGLGLAIVEAIASAHDGSIAVESVLGEGSVFELRLPRRGPAAEPALQA